MIVVKQKSLKQILKSLADYQRVFLIGCGDCATTCKAGGEEDLLRMKEVLEKEGKIVCGWAVPETTCVSSQVKISLAKITKGLREAEALLVLACGSGVQAVKENLRLALSVFPGCDTLFGAIVDGKGNLYERCSACGECILDLTGGICPLTRCSKGLLNGPCGGMDKGKCEVDREEDCVWALIYQELEKIGKLDIFRSILAPKDYSKGRKPHKLILNP